MTRRTRDAHRHNARQISTALVQHSYGQRGALSLQSNNSRRMYQHGMTLVWLLMISCEDGRFSIIEMSD